MCSYSWYDCVVIESLRLLLADADGCGVRGLEEVVAVRGLLDQVEARWLAALNEVVVSGEAEAAAGVSITDCLAEQTRRTRSEVRGWVNVAKRLDATSLIAERVADGRLSLGQALGLVRGRTKRTAAFFDEHEAFLVDTAGALSADRLQVFMSQW